MKSLVYSVLLIIGAAALGLYFSFGTVSPCEILRKELSARALKETMSEIRSAGLIEQVGQTLAITLLPQMIRNLVDTLSPAQCISRYNQIKFEGANPSDTLGFSDSEAARAFEPKLLHGEETPSVNGTGVVLSDEEKVALEQLAEDTGVPVEQLMRELEYAPSEKSASKSTGDLVASVPASKAEGRWRSSIEKSPIDDRTNVTLSISALEPITDTFSRTVLPMLHVRCQENETDVYIVLGMTPDMPYSSDHPDHAAITIRYDDSPAKEQWFPVSTDREAVFFENPISSIKRLLATKKMLIRFTPFNESPRIVNFNVDGLPKVIKPLRKACAW